MKQRDRNQAWVAVDLGAERLCVGARQRAQRRARDSRGVGALAAGSAEKIFDRADPGCIVIDEILGIFVTLTLAPNHPVAWLLGFLFFRVFDVLKPFPIGWLDSHLHGGIGIMVDDVIAGIYALIALQVVWLVVGRFF